MSMMQEKMYMDVDDVCAILGVSKTYAYSLMREYNKELKASPKVSGRTCRSPWSHPPAEHSIQSKCRNGSQCRYFILPEA